MKKKVLTVMVATMVLGSSLTAFAAPETMPDGTVFDAEYYAQNNPDVTAAFGTDKEALFNHYAMCGKAEGRLAHGENAVVPVMDMQGMTLPYFTIVCDDEIESVKLSLQSDGLFYARDNLIDASAGINGKTFTISNLYLPDNYLEFVYETGDVFSTAIPIAYDFNIGLIYSPATEDFIPRQIAFEPDGGIVLKFY